MPAFRLNAGFTLIEIMISVILVGIMLSMSASLGSLVESFRLDYANQRLYSSSALTRSEAIKRGVQVSMCRSVTGLNCDTSDTNWAAGWVVFVNPNNNDSIDSGEEIIRVYNALDGSLRLTWNSGNRLNFIPRGNPTANGSFTLCIVGRSSSPIRNVAVSTTGQIRKSSGTGVCI